MAFPSFARGDVAFLSGDRMLSLSGVTAGRRAVVVSGVLAVRGMSPVLRLLPGGRGHVVVVTAGGGEAGRLVTGCSMLVPAGKASGQVCKAAAGGEGGSNEFDPQIPLLDLVKIAAEKTRDLLADSGPPKDSNNLEFLSVGEEFFNLQARCEKILDALRAGRMSEHLAATELMRVHGSIEVTLVGGLDASVVNTKFLLARCYMDSLFMIEQPSEEYVADYGFDPELASLREFVEAFAKKTSLLLNIGEGQPNASNFSEYPTVREEIMHLREDCEEMLDDLRGLRMSDGEGARELLRIYARLGLVFRGGHKHGGDGMKGMLLSSVSDTERMIHTVLGDKAE